MAVEGDSMPAGAAPGDEVGGAATIIPPPPPPAPSLVRRALAWPLVERRAPVAITDPGDGTERRRSDPVNAEAVRTTDTIQAPPMEPFRWAAIAVGLIVATPEFHANTYRLFAATVAVIGYATYRTIRPISYHDVRTATYEAILDFAFHTVIVLLTGAWESAYEFSLLPCALLVGFVRGSSFAVRTTSIAVLVVSLRYMTEADGAARGIQLSAAWTALLLAVAITSGFARQVSRESARQQSLALDRLGRLAEANALLFSLHRVAQSLPASLDLDEVLDSTLTRLRDLIQFDTTTIFLYEESDRSWTPVRHAANPTQASLVAEVMPPPLQHALQSRNAVSETDLRRGGGPGLTPNAASGIYAALQARGSLIGVIAVEANRPNAFAAKEIELLNGLVEPFGIAIDNARWFARLRSIGADEERTRIARDLHDQIGQSLAHLGFELDRAVRSAGRGDDVEPVLQELRTEVRSVVRTVRETLYDLRTDVSESQDVGTTMELFLDRVRGRAGIDVAFEREDSGRLPILQERELWRIAKEAVINVERHAKAANLWITWRCDGRNAELVVRDDGKGFVKSDARVDSYGMIGMRERATSVGARFDIDSTPGQGTTVRITLAPT